MSKIIQQREALALSEAASTMAKRGASKGGKATAAKLTPAQRSANASKASRARWAKRDAARNPLQEKA